MHNENTKIAFQSKSFRETFAALLVSVSLLIGCGQSKSPTAEHKIEQDKSKQTANTSNDDDFESNENAIETSPKKKDQAKAVKPQLNLEGKKTGKLIDIIIMRQQNEFLGATSIKLSKLGARLDSNSLTVIMIPGKKGVAYNPSNGATMALTAKSAVIMSGAKSTPESDIETKIKKLGNDKIAGLKCTHYYVEKYATDQKTKKRGRVWYAEIWATKDVEASPAVLKECSTLLVIPPELGFPLRITRFNTPTEREKSQGEKAKKITRDVITTSSYEKAKVDEGQFALLEGFKPVKNEMELMMSDTDSELTGVGGDDMDSLQ